MRRAQEQKLWTQLDARPTTMTTNPVMLESGLLSLRSACTVLGGLNGAGKSRLLRELSHSLDGKGIYVDLHRICEQVHGQYRAIPSFEDLLLEVDPQELHGPDLEDVERVIHRKYDQVLWYALDLGPSDEETAARFKWGSDSPSLPYFEVRRGEAEYSAPEMGLGELSIHLLFWIISQYRATGLTLILDEPDAYLPPIGVEALLDRLLRVCVERQWRLVISSHSTEIVTRAVEQSAFVRVTAGEAKMIKTAHSADDASVADELLGKSPVELLYFVEDESAHALAKELISRDPNQLGRSSSGVWGSGFGYLVKLQKHLPRAPNFPLYIVLLFDGDMRSRVNVSPANSWPAIFLPTAIDPDSMFKSVGMSNIRALAALLNQDLDAVGRYLDGQEAADAHDWVDNLGLRFGRASVLPALSRLWVDQHPAEAKIFLEELRQAVEMS